MALKLSSFRFAVVGVAVVALGGLAASLYAQAQATKMPLTASPADLSRSQAAFTQIAAVMRHPRCLNCHTVTDFPRQGNERRRHDMLVVRGPDDHGAAAMRCVSCHQNVNQANGVPGAANWGLAPLSMAWEGLDDHQLAEALKNPASNGKRSLEQIFHHMVHDELVGWGWEPGANRDPVPLPRDEFARVLREWIDTGAASPAPAKSAPKY